MGNYNFQKISSEQKVFPNFFHVYIDTLCIPAVKALVICTFA